MYVCECVCWLLHHFPLYEKQRIKELRHHFIKTIPEKFKMKIQTEERIRKRLGQPKRMPWEEIMEFAEEEDRENLRNKKHIRASYQIPVENVPEITEPSWLSSSGYDVNYDQYDNVETNFNTNTRRGNPKQHGSNQNRMRQNQGKPLPNDKQSSPRVPDNRSNGTRDFNGNANTRPIKDNSQFCHWCGRTGHIYEACWRKNGCCLLCGSSEHKLQSCHLFKPNTPQLRCPMCSGPHLGKDCTVQNTTTNYSQPSENYQALEQ